MDSNQTDAKHPNPSKPILTPGTDDPVPTDEFLSDLGLGGADPTIAFHIETGRNVDTEMDPSQGPTVSGPPLNGGAQAQSKPDPTLRAYESDAGHLITLSTSDTVFYAIWTDMDLTPILLRLVRSIEDEYDGIKFVQEFEGTDGYESIQQAVELLVRTVRDDRGGETEDPRPE